MMPLFLERFLFASRRLRPLLVVCAVCALGASATGAHADCIDYSEHLHWIASVPDPGGIMGVTVDGNLAYAAASDSGLYVIDVSAPEHPVKLGRANTPGSATDVALSDGYAYVADLFGGLQVIDVHDAAHPKLVGGISTSLPAVSIAITGTALYVGEARLPYHASSKLEVFDISIPNAPELAAILTTPSWVWDIALAGDAAYLAIEERGLMRVDITDPFDPGAAGVIALPGLAQGVAVEQRAEGDLIYVGDGSAGLQIVWSPPGAPLESVGSVSTEGSANGIALYEHFACVATDGRGLVVADVSDPVLPRVVGQHDAPWTCWNVAVAGSVAYVADLYSLECVELANIPSLVEPISSTYEGGGVDVAVADSIAYLACESQGVQIVSVADPLSPAQLSVVGLPGAVEGVFVRGDYLYTANWGGGLSVTSVADPAHPILLGSASIGGPAWDLDVEGSYAFVAAYRLFVVDISDPAHPVVVASVQTSPDSKARRVDVLGSIAYVADETAGLVVVDVSAPLAPVVIRTVAIPGGAFSVAVRENRAFVGGKNKVFYDVDTSAPGSAQITGSLPLSVYGMRMVIDDRYVYVASNWAKGMHVVDVVDPMHPAIAGELRTMGGGQGVDLSGGLLYIADQPYLTIASPHCPSPLSDVADAAPIRRTPTLAVAPNPSSGDVKFHVQGESRQGVRLVIHDASGRRIRSLQMTLSGEGGQLVEWNGRDDTGLMVPSGVYYARTLGGRVSGSAPVIISR